MWIRRNWYVRTPSMQQSPPDHAVMASAQACEAASLLGSGAVGLAAGVTDLSGKSLGPLGVELLVEELLARPD